MSEPTDASDKWAEFLNPDVVRTKFITLGLFMIAYEMLLDAIIRHPLEFFGDINDFFEHGEYRITPKYRNEVLARDPKGKNDTVRGSIAFLQSMSVIDEADGATFKELTDVRNKVAHELRKLVGGEPLPDLLGFFPKATNLTVKIDRWWIVNVDMATDPEWDDKEVDTDNIVPGSSWVLDILRRVALGDDEEAWQLFRKFEADREKPSAL